MRVMNCLRATFAVAFTCLAGCAQVLDLDEFKDGNTGSGGGSSVSSVASTSANSTSSSGQSSSSGGPICGNGMQEGTELCDGNCPVDCIDPDLCTAQKPMGDPLMCDVTCPFTPIVACKGYDGCCPPGCIFSNDNDCEQRILILGGDSQNQFNVRDALQGTMAFGTVDAIIVPHGTALPPLTQLTPYSAVLVYNFLSFDDATQAGDLLADYFDMGGRVVLMGGANCADQYRLRGRFETDGYFLNNEGGVLSAMTNVDPQYDEPMSSLLANANLTTIATHCDIAPIGETTVVASLADGKPLVLRGKRKGKNRVDLNFLPSTDLTNPGALALMVNALKYPRD
jgi:hypothetical protein